MGKFDGVLLCTDCDGTLTDEDARLSEKNAAAIRYFQKEGGLFTLATGRSYSYVLAFLPDLEVNAPVIALNGVVLYDCALKRTISRWMMAKDKFLDILNYVRKIYPGVWEYWLTYDEKTQSVRLPGITGSFPEKEWIKAVRSMPDEVAKAVFFMPEDLLPVMQTDLRKSFGDTFRFDSSWKNGLEMQSVKSSKGLAVEYLKHYLEDIRLTVCVGDYDNDISMLKAADTGYAVANATDEVKKAASRLTVSNSEDALAAVIADLGSTL